MRFQQMFVIPTEVEGSAVVLYPTMNYGDSGVARLPLGLAH